ncbi:MAG: hypothetical protein BWK78_05465, partial [Thiotrichaceae bacterium IS1]
MSTLYYKYKQTATHWAAIGLMAIIPLGTFGAPPPIPPEVSTQLAQQGSARVIIGLDVPWQPEGLLRGAEAVAAQRTQLATTQTQFITQLNQDLVDSGLIDHANSNGQPTVSAGRQFETIPYVVMEVNSQTLPIVQQNALATSLELDVADKPTLAQSLPLIGADKAWAAGYTGKGQTIAILDTGVEKSHPFFATNRIVQEACFSTTFCPNGQVQQVGAGAAAPCTYDSTTCAHGTHVAGIAASVAKEANLIAVQVFSKNFGLTSSLKSDQLSALDWLQKTYGNSDSKLAAVNLSLGSGKYATACDSDARKKAIENLRSVGIATIVSSGNNGYTDGIGAPACISSAISVGATDKSDNVASFSNSANILNLLAPGVDIVSSLPGGQTGAMSGTSMASPHVAGAWAVLKAAKPQATVDELLTTLQSTGKAVTGKGVTKARVQLDKALLPPITDNAWLTFLGGKYTSEEIDYGSRTTTTDENGNIYIAGYSQDSWGNPINPHNRGMADIFVAKLSNSGVLQWHTFLGRALSDAPRKIMVNKNGDIYVVGRSSRPTTSGHEVLVAKLNKDGVLQWQTFFGGQGDISYNRGADDFLLDENENIYVTGRCIQLNDGLTWCKPVNFSVGTTARFFTKLDNKGVLQWNFFVENEYGSISIDASGNVYMSGRSETSWGTPINPYAGKKDVFIAKWNGNGVLQWNTFLGGVEDDTGGLTIVGGNDVYVVGQSNSNWGTPINPYAEKTDGFIAKLDGNGALKWNTFLGGMEDDHITTFKVVEGNAIYVGGDSGAGWGTPINSYAGGSDAFVAQLDTQGVLKWHTLLGGTGDDTGGIALDSSNNIYVIGGSSASWGSPINAYAGTANRFVAQLNSRGMLQWNTFWGHKGWSQTNSVIDKSGNIYMAGSSDVSWGTPINAYSGGDDGFVTKISNRGEVWNTFLGGKSNEWMRSLLVDGNNNIYVIGRSVTNWGTPIIPHSSTDGWNAFVAKINVTPVLTNYSLTITKNGTGNITGQGIDCGTDCTEDLAPNTQVTLTATATTGSSFTGW